MGVKLVKPLLEYKKSFLEALREFEADKKSIYINDKFSTINSADLENTFEDFIDRINNRETGTNLPEGRVPQTQLWLVEDGKFVGWVKIRHKLNDKLLNFGGNIGYAIRPSKRKMGYGTKALALALPFAKSLGINKVLITCDDDNVGSAKIIEKNGGVLENKIEAEGKLKRRYWIENK